MMKQKTAVESRSWNKTLMPAKSSHALVSALMLFSTVAFLTALVTGAESNNIGAQKKQSAGNARGGASQANTATAAPVVLPTKDKKTAEFCQAIRGVSKIGSVVSKIEEPADLADQGVYKQKMVTLSDKDGARYDVLTWLVDASGKHDASKLMPCLRITWTPADKRPLMISDIGIHGVATHGIDANGEIPPLSNGTKGEMDSGTLQRVAMIVRHPNWDEGSAIFEWDKMYHTAKTTIEGLLKASL